jgi:phosphoenolpyruvate carboxykinase (ATP)
MKTEGEAEVIGTGTVGVAESDMHGLEPREAVHWNLSPVQLYERALERGEGRLAHMGGFVAITTPHTGRSPGDRFIVRESLTGDTVDWDSVGVPLSEEHFYALREEVIAFLNGQELFIRDVRVSADPNHALNVRVVNHTAWHNLFAYNMFLRPSPDELAAFHPEFTVLHAPGFQADPAKHGTATGTFIVVNFKERQVLIGGSSYAGEMKKSIFSVLNYMLPDQGVLPMHCSANIGRDGDTALFFGLSGTGKTTLSADPERRLIGDDEHGWGGGGVFNFEGGCYAKAIRLSLKSEPEIYRATHMFGTILENVVLHEGTGEIDFDDATITENTRASYPIHYIPNAVIPGRGDHPKNVVFLTADAFGVLPPISKLTPDQAMYHFLSGYTAKVAGTERGVTEPRATFSACFGAPFLPRRPGEYANMLGERLHTHGARVWLVNTGWSGGGYGVGSRMKLSYTRAMVRAALACELDQVETVTDPIFGLAMPSKVPDVPPEILNPYDTWTNGADYDAAAGKLVEMFRKNFSRFEAQVPDQVKAAGPK